MFVLKPLNTWAAPSRQKLVLIFVVLLWGQGEAADQGLVGQWGNSNSKGVREWWDSERVGQSQDGEGVWGNPDPRKCGRVGYSRWGDAHRVKGLRPTQVKRNCPDTLQRLRVVTWVCDQWLSLWQRRGYRDFDSWKGVGNCAKHILLVGEVVWSMILADLGM